MKKRLAWLVVLVLLLSGCGPTVPKNEGTQIKLSDTEMPQGERPEMPEGAENMTPPDNMGEMADGNRMPNGETSATFTIVKGENQFSNVCAVAE